MFSSMVFFFIGLIVWLCNRLINTAKYQGIRLNCMHLKTLNKNSCEFSSFRIYFTNLGPSSGEPANHLTSRKASALEDKPDHPKLDKQSAVSDQMKKIKVLSKNSIRRNYLEFDQADPLLTFANIKSTDPMVLFVKSNINLEMSDN